MLGLGLGLNTSVVVAPAAAVAAVTLNPTSGVNKYSGITLTNGNLTAESDTGGNYELVRATRAANGGDVQFEVTINNNNNFNVCIEDGTQDFSTAGAIAIVPGNSSFPTSGYSFHYVNGNGFLSFIFNNSVQQFPSCTIAVNDKLTFQLNKGTGTIKVLLNGTQLGTTITGMTWTNWYAALAVANNSVTPEMTVNFAGPFSFGTNAAY